jgi:NhaP-type Na+/H+ or K+/H+ antiporter
MIIFDWFGSGLDLYDSHCGDALIFGTHMILPVDLVFGALISATDPVVVAFFRSFGVPKPYATLIEDESFF